MFLRIQTVDVNCGQGIEALVFSSAHGLRYIGSGELFRTLEQRIEPTVDY